MAGYASRVKHDIARWRAQGLIDARTAEALSLDIERIGRNSLSFGSILAMMAALLLAAAILVFVAANWEAIPRFGRVGALFALILAGYVGGAVLKGRDHSALGEALFVVAAAAFGGSIALVGQMYHLSGDESPALLTWCAGTALSALLLRSGQLTVAAIAIAGAWLMAVLFNGFDIFGSMEFPHLFVVIVALLFGLSYWTRSQPARHLCLLSLIVYAALFAVDHDVLSVALALAAVSAACFAVAVLAPARVDRFLQLGGRLPLHAMVGFLTGVMLLQLEIADGDVRGFAILSAAALAGIAIAIVFAGRESRGLRWISYLGFALELFIIYAVTMQTMLGTAGFFLVAAVILGVVAIAIIRIEKRLNLSAAGEA